MSSPNLLKSLNATSMHPVPSEQPRNVYAKDKASATVIYLSWQSPPEHTIHGILRGYYIWYSIIRLGIYDETPVFPQDYRKKQLPAESKSDALTELESYATYDIRIAAFTSKGYGPIKALSSSKYDILFLVPDNMNIFTMSYIRFCEDLRWFCRALSFVGRIKTKDRNSSQFLILSSAAFLWLFRVRRMLKEFLRRSKWVKGKTDLQLHSRCYIRVVKCTLLY